mmetsp:Transcript_18854/g.27626  ORF Transcript_18854/g.27626 Transcript_18854/m.27626 type:complete len:305 (-) Transcript_18854:306-1220(-)
MQSGVKRFESGIFSPVVDKSMLCQLARDGIPKNYRAETWKVLCGYLPVNSSRRGSTLKLKRSEYRKISNDHYASPSVSEQEILRQIRLDVPRTAPKVALFQDLRVQNCLERVLYTWAMRYPSASYVQGINDLVTPLFAVFLSEKCNDGNVNELVSPDSDSDISVTEIISLIPTEALEQVEADCFWCLSNILSGINDHYTPEQPGLKRMIRRFELIMARIDADLCEHLLKNGVEFILFAFRWMNCLLVRELNLMCVIRMWDTYLAQDSSNGFDDFHIYVCASLLHRFSKDLKRRQDFEELFSFLN